MAENNHDVFGGRSPFEQDEQLCKIEQFILISSDNNYSETVRSEFAQQAQELLSQLSNEALRARIDQCEATESEAIDRGDAGCDAEPGFTNKCGESAKVGRVLLMERLRRDMADPEQHMLRSWRPPSAMCVEVSK
jgi:hypothetical protein